MPKKASKNKIVGRLPGRPKTAEELRRLEEIRAAAKRDFPPAKPQLTASPSGLAEQLRLERERQKLTWYAVARLANIPNPATIRDIECGRDAKLSNIEAVAQALGMRLELVHS